MINTKFKAIVTSGGLPRKWTTVNDTENLSGIFNLLFLNLEVDSQCLWHFLHKSFQTRISLFSSGYWKSIRHLYFFLTLNFIQLLKLFKFSWFWEKISNFFEVTINWKTTRWGESQWNQSLLGMYKCDRICWNEAFCYRVAGSPLT